MAALCVALPGLTPAQYWDLTVLERDALVAELNRAVKT